MRFKDVVLGLVGLVSLGCLLILIADLVLASGIISVAAVNWAIGFITLMSVLGVILGICILVRAVQPIGDSSHLGHGIAWLALIIYVQFPFPTFFYWAFCISMILGHINIEFRPRSLYRWS